MKKIQILVSVIAVLLAACSGDLKKIEDLKAEVMAVHDHDAMPKMEKIMSLSSRLKAEVSSLEEGSEEREAELNEGIAALKVANESMMNWMRNYNAKMEGMNTEEKVSYLESEKEAINAVNKQMDEAIAQAKMLLGEE